MTQRRGPGRSDVEIKLGKNFPERRALAGELVISESASLIGIIDDANLPPSIGQRLLFWQK